MKKREEILNQFILDTLNNEECRNLQIVTKQDISKLAKKFEDAGIRHVSIDPDFEHIKDCLLYTSPSPRDKRQSRMPSSA